MKKRISLVMATAFSAGLLLAGCSTPAEKVENARENVVEAQEDLDRANAEYRAEIERYKMETNERVASNEQILADFKARMKEEKKQIKADMQAKIDELEQKNLELKRRMEEYKDEGKNNWEQFKAEFNHDMDELGQAFKDLGVDNVKDEKK